MTEGGEGIDSNTAKLLNNIRFNKGTHKILEKNKEICRLKQLNLLEQGIHASQIKLTCPHCGITGSKGTLVQHHFDYCKRNPNRKEKSKTKKECPYCHKLFYNKNHENNCKLNPNKITKEILICPYCNFKSTSKSNMKLHHFDNCKLNPNKIIKEKKVYSCKYCGFESFSNSVITQFHNENCKKNPNKIIKEKENFCCPHCGLESTNVRNMKRWHFDNCDSNPINRYKKIK